MSRQKKPVVIHFVGPSGSGKTTLIEKLIRIFRARGVAVGAIKHAHHGFDMDRPGKDSFRFRAAGAGAVAVVSPTEAAVIFDTPRPFALADTLKVVGKGLDLVLVEGFREPKGWCFHVEADGLAKPLKKGPGFLGTIFAGKAGVTGGVGFSAERPVDIADFLVARFRLMKMFLLSTRHPHPTLSRAPSPYPLPRTLTLPSP